MRVEVGAQEKCVSSDICSLSVLVRHIPSIEDIECLGLYNGICSNLCSTFCKAGRECVGSEIKTIMSSAYSSILWQNLPTEIPGMRRWALMVTASGSIIKAKMKGYSGHP